MNPPESMTPDGEFTRRSAHESICMCCFLTVRTAFDQTLEEAEREHLKICHEMPGAAS